MAMTDAESWQDLAAAEAAAHGSLADYRQRTEEHGTLRDSLMEESARVTQLQQEVEAAQGANRAMAEERRELESAVERLREELSHAEALNAALRE